MKAWAAPWSEAICLAALAALADAMELDYNLGLTGDAVFSEDLRHRYILTRSFMPGGGLSVVWVLLNPSTADADVNDPTITRVCDFSKRWGYGSAIILNLFAVRSPDPKILKQVADPGRGIQLRRVNVCEPTHQQSDQP